MRSIPTRTRWRGHFGGPKMQEAMGALGGGLFEGDPEVTMMNAVVAKGLDF